MISTVRRKTLDILFPPQDDEEEEQDESPKSESSDLEQCCDGENTIHDDKGDNKSPLPLCAICLEYLTIGKQSKRNIVVVPCDHAFHRECIMKWMLTGSEHDDCPTCRQPLWNAEMYHSIASKFPPDDPVIQHNNNDAALRDFFDQASQQRRFRLVYCALFAILVQITVFSLVIYTSNHHFPVTNSAMNSADQHPFDSTFSACGTVGFPVPLLNATVAARCQYAQTCTVDGVSTERACQCLCYQGYGADQAHYNSPASQDCTCVRIN